MKLYSIYLPHEEHAIYFEGEMLQHNETTGQSLIYSKNDPTYTNLVAVIPARALITIES